MYMLNYFDKDFFKFFLGFLAIISISLVVIFATKLYQEGRFMKPEKNNAGVTNSVE